MSENKCHKCGKRAHRTLNEIHWCLRCLVKHLYPIIIVKFKGIGRNDECPCGSGKKYKKCHLDQNEFIERFYQADKQGRIKDLDDWPKKENKEITETELPDGSKSVKLTMERKPI